MKKVIGCLKQYYNDIFIVALSFLVFSSITFLVCKLPSVSSVFFKSSFIVLLLYLVIKIIDLFAHDKFKNVIKQKESILFIAIIITSLIAFLSVLINGINNHVSFSFDYFTKVFLIIACLVFVYIGVTTKINKTSIKIISFLDVAVAVVFILGLATGFANGKEGRYYNFNFSNPNAAAQILLVITTILIISIFIFNKLWVSIVYLLLAITMIIFTFLTGSRGSIFALFLGLIFTVIILLKKKIGSPRTSTILLYVLIPFMVVIIYIPVIYLFVVNNVKGSTIISSLYTRYGIWTDGFKAIMKNPFFGVYLSNGHYHSSLLDTWANYGVFVFIGVIFIFTYATKITLDKYQIDSYYSRIVVGMLFISYMMSIAEMAFVHSPNGSYILELLPLILIKTPLETKKIEQ